MNRMDVLTKKLKFYFFEKAELVILKKSAN